MIEKNLESPSLLKPAKGCCLILSLFLLFGCGTSGGTGAVRTANCGDIPAAATHLPQVGGTDPGDLSNKPIPTYGKYNFAVTDYFAVDCGTLKTFADTLTDRTGVPIRIVNRLEEVKEGSSALQIVNNVRVEQLERFVNPAVAPPSGTSLFTLYLPPAWKKTESLPILLRGLGYTQSNNMVLTEPFFPDLVADSRKDGKRGLILATSNTGGMEGLGLHDSALNDVGRFLTAMQGMGGNPQEVIMTGTSRGGIVSFVWTANRLNYPYKTVAIFAEVPTPRVGRIFDFSLQTYPAVIGVFSVILGPDGWKRSDDPTAKADIVEILAGSRTGLQADQTRMPLGYLTDRGYAAKWQALQAVVIGGSFHDEWIPLPMTLELDRLLSAVSPHHLSILVLGSGHAGASAPVREELAAFLDHFLQPASPPYSLPREGRVYLLQNDLLSQGTGQVTSLNTQALPFTASFPYMLGVDQPGSLMTCGPEGKPWKAALTDHLGVTVPAGEGIFGGEECTHTPFSLPSPGPYLWSFEFDGAPQKANNTSCLDPNGSLPLPALTEVVDHKPSPSENFAPKCTIGFGLDQYQGPNKILPP